MDILLIAIDGNKTQINMKRNTPYYKNYNKKKGMKY